MDGDYFDDDELINDYMEEVADQQPPEYDEAYLEEAAMMNMGGGGDTTNETKQDEQQQQQQQQVEMPQEETTEPMSEEPPLQQIVTFPHVREKQDHLYKFERYQGNGEWRTKPKAATNTMTANEWKRHGVLDKAGGGLLNSSRSAPSKSSSATPAEVQLVEFLNRDFTNKKKFVISSSSEKRSEFLPIEGNDSVPITLANGTRIHVKKEEEDSATLNNHKEILNAGGGSGPILGVPMSELLRRSDAIRRRSERQKRRLRLKVSSSLSETDTDPASSGNADITEESEKTDDSVQMEHVQQDDSVKKSRTEKKEEQDHQLWVDKHAPTVFPHLLSDERTNREVLRAIRAWDPYVFRRAPPPRPVIMQKKLQQSSPPTKQKRNASDGAEDGSTEQQRNDIRPDESNRVILLSGPPGVGKTTLAHIVARHAGYRPMEVNASDERSAAVLKERVARAMDSTTLNFSSKSGGGNSTGRDELKGRPNCLILDEIDGADAKGAISALVDIIRADIPPKGTKGGKNNKSTTHLRRPIIFICNHKYAPALRALLPYARQFDVAPPSATRLVARLRSVLSAENMSLMGGSSLLYQLVAGAGGDIRSCLYTLQFASARAREMAWRKKLKEGVIRRDASVVDISQSLGSALGASGNGMKDERNDVAGTITAIFRKLKNQRLGDKPSSSNPSNRSVERVLQLVESFGDNSKTLDCLFTNLLQVSYIDPTLDRCSAAHEWLSSADIYRSHKTSVASNNNMEHHAMQRFHMPTSAAAVHLLCRVETRSELTFSIRQLMDSRYQLEANTGLLNKFVEGLAPKVRGGVYGSNVVTETVPYSLWMLSAGEGNCSLNRTVSTLEILNSNERMAFDAHVATLRALGLTYVKMEDTAKASYGAASNVGMRLEPQIDRVVEFADLSVPSANLRKEVPSVLKELLAHSANIAGMLERDTGETKANQGGKFANNKCETKTSTSSELTVPSESKSSNENDAKKHKRPDHVISDPPSKRLKTMTAPRNFLGIGAAKAKAARTARKAALVGFDRSKKMKLSNTGSGVPFSRVIRFKYQKGFTQAVRTPCRHEDLV